MRVGFLCRIRNALRTSCGITTPMERHFIMWMTRNFSPVEDGQATAVKGLS